MRFYYDLFQPNNGKRAETSDKCKLFHLLFKTNRKSATDPRDTYKSQAPQRLGQWISSNVIFSKGYAVKGLSLSPRHLAGHSVL